MDIPPWLGTIFRFTVFILLENAFSETPSPPWYDLIINSIHVEQSPNKKPFFEKNPPPHTLGGRHHEKDFQSKTEVVKPKGTG